jgi:hypothetical protein
MALKMRIICVAHDGKSVVPAGDQFHFLPPAGKDANGEEIAEFELDGADLYCTGGTNDAIEHEFVAEVRADSEESFANIQADGMGIEIIV